MDVDEIASLLHFGAERAGQDNPRISSTVKKEFTEFGLAVGGSSEVDEMEKRKIVLEKEIRLKTIELEQLRADSLPSTSYSREPPKIDGKGFFARPLIDLDIPHNSREPPKVEEKGFSVQQLAELVQIFKTLQSGSSCPVSESVHENRIIDLAPRFDLKDPNASWKAFEVFFDINRVVKEDIKFNILNNRIPWETMRQFGKENPHSGGNLNKLEMFLKAYGKQCAPSMYHRNSVGKYGSGSLLREVLHEAKSMADLDRGERIKLNAYLLSTGPNQNIIKSYMHLPVEQFFAKVSQKWNDSDASKPKEEFLGRRSPPRAYREYKNKTYNNQQHGLGLCYYHDRFGRDAFKCSGNECKMRGMITKPMEGQRVNNVNRQPLGN